LIPILGSLKSCCSLLVWPKRVVFQYISEGIFIIFFSLYKKKVIIKKIGWLISFSDNFEDKKRMSEKNHHIYVNRVDNTPFKYWHNWTSVLFCSKVQKGTCYSCSSTWQWPKIARDVQSR
jgi:hypothetical protein